jgi:N-acetylglutamate synthase-like GNAT family acetyltransferase
MIAFNEFFEIDATDAGLKKALHSEHLKLSKTKPDRQTFWRLGPASGPAGFIGVEQYGAVAVLRSILVTPDYKDHGYGAGLISLAAGKLRHAGVREIWAVTETAKSFFEHLGWMRRDDQDVPEPVRHMPLVDGTDTDGGIYMSTRLA